jgi:tape measure domain-containing protein
MSETVVYTLTLKDLLTGKIQVADGAVDKFENKMRKAQTTANNLANAVGVAFGTAAVVAFGQRMIQAGTKVEDALTGLTTLLRDQAAAQEVINNTMEDATKTPFAFEGLLAANKALISAGVSAKDARTDVLNLANAIAATGGGDDELQRMVVNLQQIKNTGEATAADIKQFAFAGVNIYKVLADSTGQPIEKVKELGVSYDALTAALAKAAGEGGIYANGLANMAQNTSVRISNLGDGIFQLGVTMFNDLKPAIDTVISGLASLVDAMSAGWNWLVRNRDAVYAVSVGLGVVAGAYAIYRASLLAGVAIQGIQTAVTYVQIAAMYTLGTAYGTASIFTKLMAAAQYALNAAMTANPIGIVIVALGALTAGVVYAYNQFGTFRAVLWGVWGVIKAWAALVVDAFEGVWKVIKGVFTLDGAMVIEGFKQSADVMVNAGRKLAEGFKTGYDEGMKDFASDQAKKTVAAPKNVAGPTAGGGTKTTPAIAPVKAETKGAQAAKAVTINVTIGSLIKDFKIQTTNVTEGAAKVREMVAQALVSATNDSQLIAGQ